MAIFFTADTHFGHLNIIKHCRRPFKTLEDMNETLILNWNACVNEDDHVYIAGDFAWRGGLENAMQIVKRLKGIKHLAIGNHDKKFLKHAEYRDQFAQIDQMLFVGLEEGRTIVCHYPMLSWNGMERGTWHVYGHIHNNKDKENPAFAALMQMEKALNASVDICGFKPVTFSELIEYNKIFKRGGYHAEMEVNT